MNITSTRLNLTRSNYQSTSGANTGCEREECRAELRDMVTRADNELTKGTLAIPGILAAGTATFALGVSTIQGSMGTALGVAGTMVAGAATAGLVLYKRQQESFATQLVNEALERADTTGCYTREELSQWYFDNFVR